MKIHHILFCFLVGCFNCPGEDAYDYERLYSGDEVELNNLLQDETKSLRVLLNALADLNFQKHLQRRYPEAVSFIRSAIVSIPGHGKMVKGWIDELTEKRDTSRKREKCFQVLGMIGSDEAIEVAGGYLFDDRTFLAEDIEGTYDSPNSAMAARSLAAMNIPDAPTSRPVHLQAQNEWGLWRAWWKDRQARSKLPGVTFSDEHEFPSEQEPGRSSKAVGGDRGSSSWLILILIIFVVSITIFKAVGKR